MPEFREKEAQKLRAQNIRWTVSEDYEGDEGRAYARFFEENRPQSQDPETRLYYENALLGALARRFEAEKILAYASYLWEEMPGGELFTRVMAVPLEEAAYREMALSRPAIASFRRAFMLNKIRMYRLSSPNSWVEFLDLAHAQRALGQVPKVNGMGKKLLDDLEDLASKATDAFITGMQ